MNSTEEGEKWPYYYAKAMILSNSEQILYHSLVEALPQYMIFTQVSLSQVIKVRKEYNFKAWFNKINQKSLDFVVCRKDFSIVTAIELDDITHEKEERIIADKDKDKALESAGIRLIRWHVINMPDLNTIWKTISKLDPGFIPQFEQRNLARMRKRNTNKKVILGMTIRLIIPIILVVLFFTVAPSFITTVMSSLIHGKPSVEQIARQTVEPQKEQQGIGEVVAHGSEKFAKALLSPMAESAKRQQEEVKRIIAENAPRRIIGYNERRIPRRSWEDCIREFGRGKTELNRDVVRCQNGYVEKIPIYNK